jgi:hypothetical protein
MYIYKFITCGHNPHTCDQKWKLESEKTNWIELKNLTCDSNPHTWIGFHKRFHESKKLVYVCTRFAVRDKCHDFVLVFLIFESLLNCEIVFWVFLVNFQENSYCDLPCFVATLSCLFYWAWEVWRGVYFDFSCVSWVSCFVTTFLSFVSLNSKSLKVYFSKVCFHFLYVIDLLIS